MLAVKPGRACERGFRRHDARRPVQLDIPAIRLRHVAAKCRKTHRQGSRPRAGTLTPGQRVILRENRPRRVIGLGEARAADCLGAIGSGLRPFVTSDDVHDAADGVSPVECRSLRTANHFDVIDHRRIEISNQQRIGDLDTVDVHLWITDAERARAANASVLGEEARW